MRETINYKDKLIETFYAFNQFCAENDIKYYAAYGTLIGAIRHKGLIPWDDDIDVWMLPHDYEKLLSYKGKIGGHYDIIDDEDENYWLFSLIKFVDTNTTLWEAEEFPCVTGVYIDIFPMYECDEKTAIANRREYDAVSSQLTRSLRHIPLKKVFHLFFRGHSHEGRLALKDFLYSKLYCKINRRRYNNLVDRLKNIKGDVYVSYDGAYHEKEVFPKSWFLETEYLSFEGMKIPVPKEYDKVLKKLYGDYLQLPPEDQRFSLHSHFYEDLTKRMSVKEIKKILKNS